MSLNKILGGGSKQSASEARKSSASEIAATKRSAREWNDYITRFVPAGDTFLELVADFNQDRAALRGDANAAAMDSVQLAPIMRQGLAAGMDPSSGRSVAGVSDSATAARRGLAAGVAAAEPGLEERRTRGEMSYAATGRGLADAASLALSSKARTEARSAVRGAIDRFNTRSSIAEGVAGLAGNLAGRYERGNRDAWKASTRPSSGPTTAQGIHDAWMPG